MTLRGLLDEMWEAIGPDHFTIFLGWIFGGRMTLNETIDEMFPMNESPASFEGLANEIRTSVLSQTKHLFSVGNQWESHSNAFYCPTCGDTRRVRFIVKYLSCKGLTDQPSVAMIRGKKTIEEQLLPLSLFSVKCFHCYSWFYFVCWESQNGPELAVLSSVPGGMTTPNTPQGVAYYLDQAHRARSVGALSAAAAMYRAALDQLLHEQGFTEGTCGRKIRLLEQAKQAGNAPAWARDMPTELLNVIKNLGDGSIHPNDGNIDRQKALDLELMKNMDAAFKFLLDIVYEAEARRNAMLAGLSQSNDLLNG